MFATHLRVILSVIRRDSACGDFADAKFRFRTESYTQNDTADVIQRYEYNKVSPSLIFGNEGQSKALVDERARLNCTTPCVSS